MEGEQHTLHRIKEVSNLISFLREYETNTMARNAIRCSNRDDLLNFSFILKISIFSEVFQPSRTYMVQRFFCENFQWVLMQRVIHENNLRVGRGEASKPNPSKVNQAQLGGLGGGCCKLPQLGVIWSGSPLQKLFGFLRCYRLA